MLVIVAGGYSCCELEWYSAKSYRMGKSCSHPPECSSGPAITLAHLHACYIHEQVMSLSKNQYPLQCEPLDLIESNEKGAQHNAPAAIHYLQPGWCRMVLHTPHTSHTYVINASHVIYSSQAIHGAAMCHAQTQHTERTKLTPIAL